MTLDEVKHAALLRLRSSGFENPELDVRWLLEAATGLSQTAILMQGDAPIEPMDYAVFVSLIDRRATHEPVARILGQREFWGLNFHLSPATLEPRPDSETLIEAVLTHIPDKQTPLKICDLGTGTGCLLAALLSEYPQATGVGVDASLDAVDTARGNLTRLNLTDRAVIQSGNWTVGIETPFDLIISNPPYIRSDEALAHDVSQFDPALALFAGVDGLESYRAIIPALPPLLTPSGLAVLEIGLGQGAAITTLATQNQLSVVEIRDDLGGIPRAVVLQRQSGKISQTR